MMKKQKNNWFKSIRGQLIIVSISVNLIICIVAFSFMQRNINSMNQNIEDLEHINDINSLYGYQQKNSELLISSMETTGTENLQEFQFNMGVIYSLLNIIEERETEPSAKIRLRVIPYLEKTFENQVISLMSRSLNANNQIRYIKYLEALEYHTKINNYIQEILSINMEANQDYFVNSETTMSSTRNLFVIIIVAICFFNSLFFIIYHSYLTKPMNLISKKVKCIGEGHWDIDMSEVSGPEDMRGLAEKIVVMAKNIKNLSQDVKDKATLELKVVEEELEHLRMMKLLKEVQLQGIQMQIKPHFLFNTLNVISRMSLIEDSPKTYDLIMALSKFMRHSLKPMNNKIPLFEEVDMVKQYLYILKSRMGDQLDTKVQIDDNVTDDEIPIFTLQPIVENAFKHGLEDRVLGGIIVLSIRKKRDVLQIRICD
ncbi:MAG: histidine kinase, partial [Mobilitalea sp.]